ncbi:putative uncharacterized protein DDB_G0282133 isoform X2 [Sipha flava]|nr:putative uncharacterized protein DDB_G0282133 isoform X2 [Sipha flava]
MNNMQLVSIDHQHNHPEDAKAIKDLKLQLVVTEKPGNQKTWFKTTYPKTERENFKRFIPDDVKNYKIPKKFIMSKEDFHVRQYSSQNKIEKINYHHSANNNNYNKTLTDNCTTFQNSSSPYKTYSSILRNILSVPKSNFDRIPKYILIQKDSNYAGISKNILQNTKISHLNTKNKDLFSNEQEKTNISIRETVNQKIIFMKNYKFDINSISNNCKRMHAEDTECSINSSKKICVDKIQRINPKVEDTDISIRDGNKVNIDKDEDNITNDDKKKIAGIVEDNKIKTDVTDIFINDDKKMHGDIGEGNKTKEEDSDISVNGENKVSVDDNEDNNTDENNDIFSTLINDFNSENFDNFLKRLNNPKIGKKIFNTLLQMQSIIHFFRSSNLLHHQLKEFRTRQIYWKIKFQNLLLDIKQTKKNYLEVLNKNKYLLNHEQLYSRNVGIQVDIKKEMEVQLIRPISTQDYNSKLLSDTIQIDTTDSEDESLNNQKSNITISKKSDISNSGIMCLDTPYRQVISDITEKIESNVLNSICISKLESLQNVNSTVHSQNFLKYDIYSKILPFIRTKYIPKASVLKIIPKKKFIKISFTNKTSYLDTQHLSNTKILNNKLFYIKLIKPVNTESKTTFIEKKKLKNFSDRIVVLDKRSLADLVRSTSMLQKKLYTHNSNYLNSYNCAIISLPIKPVNYTELYREIFCYNKNKTHGPFLENLNDTEKHLHLPSVVLEVFLSFETYPPRAVLKWEIGRNIHNIQGIINIIDYEVAMLVVRNNNTISNGWQQIGIIKAKKLPMKCTVKLVEAINTIYYFAIRARDIERRCGPFSISLPVKY